MLMVKIIIIVITTSDGRELYIEYVLFSSLVKAKTHLHISLLMRVAKGLRVMRANILPGLSPGYPS